MKPTKAEVEKLAKDFRHEWLRITGRRDVFDAFSRYVLSRFDPKPVALVAEFDGKKWTGKHATKPVLAKARKSFLKKLDDASKEAAKPNTPHHDWCAASTHTGGPIGSCNCPKAKWKIYKRGKKLAAPKKKGGAKHGKGKK